MVSFWESQTGDHTVSGSSCQTFADYINGWLAANGSPGFTVYNCSSDPIVEGSVLSIQPSGEWVIQSLVIDNSALFNSVPFLLQCVIVIAFIFIFVRGYDSGSKL